MPWKYWIIISSVASLVVSMWITSGVQTSSITRQNSAIHTALDDVEKDMGTFDPDSSRNLSAPARAMKVARRQAELAAQKQIEMRVMMDEMSRDEMHALGADTTTDSLSTDPADVRYFDEYGRPLH